MKPSSSYSLLKFVYLTSQLCHPLVTLLRKILDPPLIQCIDFFKTLYLCPSKLLVSLKKTQLTNLWPLYTCQPQAPKVLKALFPHLLAVPLGVPPMEMQALPHPMSGAMGHTGIGPLLCCSDITSEILLQIVHQANYQQSCVTVGH